jgi:hypothetical protein
VFPWDYYANTSPLQREYMRRYYAVKHIREKIKYASAEEEAKAKAQAERRNG